MSPLVRNLVQLGLGGLVLVGAVVWLSGGCGERVAPGDLEPATQAAESSRSAFVEQEDAQLFERVSGTVSSARHTTISSKILARIEAIPVRAGDEIEEGRVVVRLDSRDLDARLRDAREQVAAAKAGLALARTERERFQGLFEQKVASRQQLDRAVADFQKAAAELESTQQRANDAEVGLSYAEIRSPVAGRVVDRLAEPGDTASPGAALLRVYDPGAMRLEAPVRESLATRLVPGQELDVEIESLDLTTRGAIDEIVPAAEPGARTFLVKVRLPADARLFAGMFGRVSVPAGIGARLVVPASAVDRIGQLEYVRVVADTGQVGRRLITTGPATPGGHVEVLSGLAAGERVLLP